MLRDIISQAEAHTALTGRFAFTLVPDTLASNLLRIGNNVVMQQGKHCCGFAWVGQNTGMAGAMHMLHSPTNEYAWLNTQWYE